MTRLEEVERTPSDGEMAYRRGDSRFRGIRVIGTENGDRKRRSIGIDTREASLRARTAVSSLDGIEEQITMMLVDTTSRLRVAPYCRWKN